MGLFLVFKIKGARLLFQSMDSDSRLLHISALRRILPQRLELPDAPAKSFWPWRASEARAWAGKTHSFSVKLEEAPSRRLLFQ